MDFLHKSASDIQKEEIDLLYSFYRKEMNFLKEFPLLTFEEFSRLLLSSCPGYQMIESFSEGEIAAFLFYAQKNGELNELEMPLFGYYYRNIRDFSLLFDELLKETIHKTTIVHFSGYCHDNELTRFLTLTQFGITTEYCVRKIRPIPQAVSPYPVFSLSKEEIEENWPEIWALVRSIIDHLKESPIFYFGDEFTKETYHEFFLDDGLSLYVAKDENGRLIGLIETNNEPEGFILSSVPNRDVGEAIVLEEYRRTGLAESLLAASEKDLSANGVFYSWVNHGTANPNAMGFWDKYFKPYQYEFERKIEF